MGGGRFVDVYELSVVLKRSCNHNNNAVPLNHAPDPPVPVLFLSFISYIYRIIYIESERAYQQHVCRLCVCRPCGRMLVLCVIFVCPFAGWPFGETALAMGAMQLLCGIR